MTVALNPDSWVRIWVCKYYVQYPVLSGDNDGVVGRLSPLPSFSHC
jgi:hypothetical protein